MVIHPIAHSLTSIRNASSAKHRTVEIPASKIKKEITKILFDKGYIINNKFEDETFPKTIKIALKYHPLTKEPAMTNIQRISSPGLRKYVSAEKLPRVLNGLGIAVISTSRGLMTDKEARALNIGGEVICYIS